ncbi:hypothetical protein N172_08945 [Pantoea dispersa EGD-AAK13]|nr:hypothetical protein N172_08945 [Pantoea dispersa EGD-AAK13]
MDESLIFRKADFAFCRVNITRGGNDPQKQ